MFPPCVTIKTYFPGTESRDTELEGKNICFLHTSVEEDHLVIMNSLFNSHRQESTRVPPTHDLVVHRLS